MIIHLNDKKLDLPYYENEDLNNLLIRVAAANNTLSTLLYLKNTTQKDIINIYDFMDSIKNDKDFITLYNNFKNFRININIQTLIELYILYNKQFNTSLKKAKKDKNIYIDAIQSSITTNTGINIVDIEKIQQNKTNIDEKIKQIKINEQKKASILENEYTKIKDINIETTDFIITDKNYIIDIELKEELSLIYVFNILNTTLTCPFIYINYDERQLYKIYSKFIIDENWIYDDEIENNSILIKFCENIYKDEFIDIVLKCEYKNLKIIINLNTKFEINNILDIFINEQIKINKYIKNKNINENLISGKYNFLNIDVNKFILLDLIMNNDELNKDIVIDETILRLSKLIKGKIFIGKDNKITFYIKQIYTNMLNGDFKIEKKSNVEILLNNILLKEFDLYKNIFENVFKKYLLYFKQKEKYYLKFINPQEININNEEDKKDITTIGKILNIYEPDVFLPNYSRLCANPPYIYNNQPNIDDNRKIIFPFDTIDNIKPTTYYCNDDKYRFPGLIRNNMDNSSKFEYLPCCYLKDQTNKMKNILNNEDIYALDLKNEYIVKTNKILQNNKYGYLPDNILHFFHLMDINTFQNTMYLREGCYRNKNSLLQCIININNSNKLTEDDMKIECKNLRKEFTSSEYIGVSKQELYDLTEDEIIKQILDDEIYFDPSLFIRMVEIKFKCKIIVLQNDTENNILSLPRFKYAYLNSENNLNNFDKYIFIYEHYGQYDKKKSYPQCELIVKKSYDINGSEKNTNFFEKDDDLVVKHIIPFINNYYECINIKLKCCLKYNYFNIVKDNLNSQIIDDCGKLRGLVYKLKDIDIIVFCAPNQPLFLPIYNKNNRNTIIDNNDMNDEYILNLINFLSLTDIKISNKDKDKILRAKMNNNQITIHFSIKESYTLNILQEYNNNEKFARYIISYTKWLFSKYIHENNITSISNIDEDINNFFIKHIEIKTDINYINNNNDKYDVSRNWIKNNKILIQNEIIKDRLIYILKLDLTHSFNSYNSLYKQMFIKNYYENIYDFESNENEYIFTRQNIKEYIKITKKLLNRYTLYNDIQIKNEPYFYNNNDINNGRIYIAYNGNSFSEILEIMYQLFNKSNTNRSVTIYHYVCKNNKILSKNDILISLKINISFVIIITTVINNKNIYTLLYDKNMYK